MVPRGSKMTSEKTVGIEGFWWHRHPHCNAVRHEDCNIVFDDGGPCATVYELLVIRDENNNVVGELDLSELS